MKTPFPKCAAGCKSAPRALLVSDCTVTSLSSGTKIKFGCHVNQSNHSLPIHLAPICCVLQDCHVAFRAQDISVDVKQRKPMKAVLSCLAGQGVATEQYLNAQG